MYHMIEGESEYNPTPHCNCHLGHYYHPCHHYHKK